MRDTIRIDNLTQANFDEDYSVLAIDITELVKMNIEYSNDGTYSEEALTKLKANKTVEHILKMIQTSFVICIYEEAVLVACGFVVEQDHRYFSKSLHVHPQFRGQGLARLICHERETFLKNIGAEEVFIESMKFPHTIKFHKCNGFKLEQPYKELKNTILMRKVLK